MSASGQSREPWGRLFVVSSPSGAGKTTLCRRLVDEFSELEFSVSLTTRPRRTGEIDGLDYHFVSQSHFDTMLSQGQLVEWAIVHGNYYGTDRSVIFGNIRAGRDILLDIDLQGARALANHKLLRNNTLRIFVLPPSMEELAQRLHKRGTDSSKDVEKRLSRARDELLHYSEYEYVIFNDVERDAYDKLRSIYVASRCQCARQHSLVSSLVEQMLQNDQ